MADALLVTKRTAVLNPNPPQPGNPDAFFGEETNDLQLNSVNDLALVSGLDKLKQDLNKILFTEVGANTNFEIYGTELQTMVGGKVDIDNARAKIREEVDTALSVLLFLTRENTNDDEVVDTFETLSVTEISTGRFEVTVSVISRSGKRAVSDSIVLVA